MKTAATARARAGARSRRPASSLPRSFSDGIAAPADQTVGGGRVAGAVADEDDLLGALGSGQRPLEVDLHAAIIESDRNLSASEESATYGDEPRDDQGVA